MWGIKQAHSVRNTGQQAGHFALTPGYNLDGLISANVPPICFWGIFGCWSAVVRQKVSRWKNNLAFVCKAVKASGHLFCSGEVLHPLFTSPFPNMNRCFSCCVINVHQRELAITTGSIRHNTSRQEVTPAITPVSFLFFFSRSLSVQYVGGWPEDQQWWGGVGTKGELPLQSVYSLSCANDPSLQLSLHLSSRHSCIYIHHITSEPSLYTWCIFIQINAEIELHPRHCQLAFK